MISKLKWLWRNANDVDVVVSVVDFVGVVDVVVVVVVAGVPQEIFNWANSFKFCCCRAPF